MGLVSPAPNSGLGPPPRPNRFKVGRAVAVRASLWASTTTYLQK
jgi:hypothetical protein